MNPLYLASVPVFQHYLRQLSALLDKAEQHAQSTASSLTWLNAKLADDMLPFHQQVEIAANFALRACFPLAGQPVPEYGDFPASVEGMQRRLQYVQHWLNELDDAAFTASDRRIIHTDAGQHSLQLPASEFLHRYAMPNFFFHFSMAYALMRSHGVPVGKADFDAYHRYEARH